ncbi:RDD family protein [Hamadaea tsunoensis]|uniref:RDD family protein n=1 Tax=Hamadaea tsunoensis TaxID=53368 RepID=UPI0005516CFC|nr:RDD family protein [Hamadaea tsunoensis]
MAIEPGWYPDPVDPSTQRYWDGEGWADQPVPIKPPPRPAQATVTEQPSVPAQPGARVRGAQGPGVPPWWPEGVQFPPAGPVRPFGLTLASPGQRLGARAIDLAALLVINIIFNGWFVYQWFVEIIPLTRAYLETGDLSVLATSRVGELELTIVLISYALWFAYEVPVTHTRGQTLGKMMVGLRVIPMEGPDRLSFFRSFRRWSWFGFPFLFFFCCGIFGFAIPIIDNLSVATDQFLHLAWHDRTARTFVVRVPPRNAPLT